MLSLCHRLLIIMFVLQASVTQANLFDFFSYLFGQMQTSTVNAQKPSSLPHTTDYTLDEIQARNYIDQCLAALDHALRPHMQDNELYKLSQIIQQTIAHSPHAYVWINGQKQYSKTKIDEFIMSGVLSYIEQTSFEYALKQGHNSSSARKIGESMRNNALARIQKHGYLDAEILVPFVGYYLEQAVHNVMHPYDTPYQEPSTAPAAPEQPIPSNDTTTSPHFQVYPSDQCCICLDSFDDIIQRIFLKPCGHDICVACAKELFFGNGKSKICPHCRAVVYLNLLQQDLSQEVV